MAAGQVHAVTSDQLWHNVTLVTEPTTLLITLFACFIAVCVAVLMRPSGIRGGAMVQNDFGNLASRARGTVRGYRSKMGGRFIARSISPCGSIPSPESGARYVFSPQTPWSREQALLERLDTIARIPERWRYLYHDDEFGRTARVRPHGTREKI